MIAGADGCKGGWILVQAEDLRTPVTHIFCADPAALFARTAPDGILAIDIPIGISDRARRQAETDAKLVVGARRSSVFWSPVRAALGAATHQEANARNRAASGLGLSAQAFHIMKRIADVDTALRADPRAAARVHEVHPEVCFTVLNGGRPMAHPKKREKGRDERAALITTVFPGAFDAIRAQYRSKQVASDDILDALVALWTAARIRAGIDRAFPDGPPPRDAFGLPMVIRA